MKSYICDIALAQCPRFAAASEGGGRARLRARLPRTLSLCKEKRIDACLAPAIHLMLRWSIAFSYEGPPRPYKAW
jgi:hypothetical protein